LEKTVEIASASGDPPPNPRWAPRLSRCDSAYYYNPLDFVSSAKSVLLL